PGGLATRKVWKLTTVRRIVVVYDFVPDDEAAGHQCRLGDRGQPAASGLERRDGLGAARVVRSVEDAAGRDALGDDLTVDDDVHRRAEAVDAAAAAGSVGNLALAHLDLGVLEEDDAAAVHEFDRGAGVGAGGGDGVAFEDGLAGTRALTLNRDLPFDIELAEGAAGLGQCGGGSRCDCE